MRSFFVVQMPPVQKYHSSRRTAKDAVTRNAKNAVRAGVKDAVSKGFTRYVGPLVDKYVFNESPFLKALLRNPILHYAEKRAGNFIDKVTADASLIRKPGNQQEMINVIMGELPRPAPPPQRWYQSEGPYTIDVAIVRDLILEYPCYAWINDTEKFPAPPSINTRGVKGAILAAITDHYLEEHPYSTIEEWDTIYAVACYSREIEAMMTAIILYEFTVPWIENAPPEWDSFYNTLYSYTRAVLDGLMGIDEETPLAPIPGFPTPIYPTA